MYHRLDDETAMFKAPGYDTTELLYESGGSIVYRAIRTKDGVPVVLKVLKAVRPAPEVIARFKREHQLTAQLAQPGIIEVHDCFPTDNHWVIVTEDFGAESLRRLELAGRIELDHFLSLAIELTTILTRVHGDHAIHNDINPSNIVLNRDTGVLKLIDFGIATREIARHVVPYSHPTRVGGTPDYLSPEQTGRMNRSVDYRSDYYALGCTFYELLTGRPPHRGADLLDLIHHHLAHSPEPPHVLRAEIPPSLSAIVLKLLAKNADERYQSGFGIRADLQECLRRYRADPRAKERFALGEHDDVGALHIPTKFYGRARELSRLLDVFSRVSDDSPPQLVMVSGRSGIGKTALVKELYAPITARRGTIASGKFDQFSRNAPFAPIVTAFSSLIDQVLCEDELQIAVWKERLAQSLGADRAVVNELVPNLDRVMGAMPPPAPVAPADGRARMTRAMLGFVRSFARPEHPLVLFMDDLQWADLASLDFIRELASDPTIRNLLIIGAYRNDEAPAGQPLRQLLREVDNLQQLELESLTTTDVADNLSDLLRLPAQQVMAIAHLVHRKTGGNPFYIRQFLEALRDQQLIRLDETTGQWTWDTSEIESSDISENVADLLVAKLHDLPARTRTLLSWASCMGSRFSLGDLALVDETSPLEVVRSLMAAIARGFVLPLDRDYSLVQTDTAGLVERLGISYKFAHDRIQHAVHEDTDDAARTQMHLQIGRRLRDNKPDLLLEIVNHLDIANALITEGDERREAARLSLRAGIRASESAAYAAAYDFCATGLSFLLPPDETRSSPGIVRPNAHAYATDYDTCLSLAERAAEAASLSSKFDAMDAMIDSVQAHAKTIGDTIGVRLVQIRTLTTRGRQNHSIDVARDTLRPLGVDLPHEADDTLLEAMADRVRTALGNRSIESLSSLPRGAADGDHARALELLREIYITTVMCRQSLTPLVAAHMVLLTLRHGRTEGSAIGLTFYGIHLCETGVAERIDEGYRLTNVARKICAEDGLNAELVDVNGQAFYHVLHLREPIRDLMGLIGECHRLAWENGNTNMVAGCLASQVAGAWVAGFELPELANDMREVIEICETRGYTAQGTWIRAYLQCAHNFMVTSDNPCRLRGEFYDEEQSVPVHQADGDALMLQLLHMLRITLGYHFRRYKEVVESYVTHVEDKYPKSGYLLPPAMMYYCLAQLAILREQDSPADAPTIMADVRSKLAQLKVWASLSPDNYQHKYHLVAAEVAHLSGADDEARNHYDDAIDLARQARYPQEEAAALECAARFFRDRGRERLASYYLQDSLYAYTRWGAEAKVAELRREYPDLSSLDHRSPNSRALDRGTTQSASTTHDPFGEDALTLEALLRASRAMSNERDPPAVLRRVMETCLTYAGATRGMLILPHQGALVIKARAELADGLDIQLVSEQLRVADDLCQAVVHFVARDGKTLRLEDAVTAGPFTGDPYIVAHGCRSILCIPILYHGDLIGIAYLENRLAARAFGTNIADVLTLLMTQAAVSLENARLRSQDSDEELWFTVGGSLTGGTPSYVHRDADRDLIRKIERGDYCYVFNARQMGKSSLRVRTVQQLEAKGTRCASVDLSAMGSTNISAEQWYAGVARRLTSSLGHLPGPTFRQWWREQNLLSPAQRLAELIDEILDRDSSTPIVIFLDEIDATLGLEFPCDDLFALIRSLFNKRADDPRYRNLSFVFLGVATPLQLIQDQLKTPFNIGHPVGLQGFRPTEARVLSVGLRDFDEPERVLNEILAWTEGQPFLTQKLCQLAVASESRPTPGRARDWVATLVRDGVIDNWRMKDEPTHLRTIEARVLRSDSKADLLELYRNILATGRMRERDVTLGTELVLSGLVGRKSGWLRVGNPIYGEVFDSEWIRLAR